jgi:hypothetical protein
MLAVRSPNQALSATLPLAPSASKTKSSKKAKSGSEIYGKIVVIKRNNSDGACFPLKQSITIGRSANNEIRVQLTTVSRQHCKLNIDENGQVCYLCRFRSIVSI